MAKNLKLGNFLMISRSHISKLQIFLKNRLHSNWRSCLVLTSSQKPKKNIWAVSKENIKVFHFGIIWRPFHEYLQIKICFQKPGSVTFYLCSPLTSCKNSEKSLELFLRKLRYQATNQPTNQPTLIWRLFCKYLL